MIFNAGGRNEVRGRSGFAHLFEHMMFEGSKHVPKGGFDRILESYGGDNNASTHSDFTFYYEVVPAHALPVAAWLDADRVSALNVSSEALHTQIEVVKEEKRMRVDNEPYGPLLDAEISSHVFSNWQNSHPVIGSFEDLDAASLKDVKEFFDAYYAPNNAIRAVDGDFEPAAAKALITEYFGWIPNKGEVPAVSLEEPAPAQGRWVKVQDPHAKLPALAFAWKAMPERRSPDYYALTLLGKALFEGKSALLFQELVKKRRSAVSVSGGLGFPTTDWEEFKAPGLFGGFIIHKAGRSAVSVRDELLKTIRKAGAAGIDARELRRVKTKFRSDWILAQQTSLGRAGKLLQAALLDGSPAAANSELDRFMAVGPEDVRRAAARYLKPELGTWFEAVVKEQP